MRDDYVKAAGLLGGLAAQSSSWGEDASHQLRLCQLELVVMALDSDHQHAPRKLGAAYTPLDLAYLQKAESLLATCRSWTRSTVAGAVKVLNPDLELAPTAEMLTTLVRGLELDLAGIRIGEAMIVCLERLRGRDVVRLLASMVELWCQDATRVRNAVNVVGSALVQANGAIADAEHLAVGRANRLLDCAETAELPERAYSQVRDKLRETGQADIRSIKGSKPWTITGKPPRRGCAGAHP